MYIFAIVIVLITGLSAFSSNASAQEGSKIKGNAEFCVETAVEHTLRCEYGTMEQCQNDIKSSNLVCIANPHSGR